jgi:hypothetical protein
MAGIFVYKKVDMSVRCPELGMFAEIISQGSGSLGKSDDAGIRVILSPKEPVGDIRDQILDPGRCLLLATGEKIIKKQWEITIGSVSGG